MSVDLNNYNNIYQPKNNPSKKKHRVAINTAATIVTAGIIAGTGSTKGGQKVVKSIDAAIKEAMPEHKSRAKSLWGKITGSAKREEARKAAEEEAQKAREHANKVREELEARYKEEKRAIEERKRAYAEAANQRQTQRAKTEKAAEATSKEKELQKLAELAKIDGQKSIDSLFGLRITEKEFTYLNDETKRKILSFCNPDGTLNFSYIEKI